MSEKEEGGSTTDDLVGKLDEVLYDIEKAVEGGRIKFIHCWISGEKCVRADGPTSATDDSALYTCKHCYVADIHKTSLEKLLAVMLFADGDTIEALTDRIERLRSENEEFEEEKGKLELKNSNLSEDAKIAKKEISKLKDEIDTLREALKNAAGRLEALKPKP